MFAVSIPRSATRLFAVIAVNAALLTATVEAGTIVRVNTSMGFYSIELLDDTAPATVQNFLNYVNRNDYNNTYLHRVVDGFVAQGGGYSFTPWVGPVPIPADPSVVNEFGASNIRGTVAMAKTPDDPNSATSQWFVNLADNSGNLDSANGGFTVFGNVLGNGMAILDAIDSLRYVSLGSLAPSTPYVTEFYNLPYDFVYQTVEVVERFSAAVHVYESGSGILITSVSVLDDATLFSLNFSTVSAEPAQVIQPNLDSVINLRDSFDSIATFALTDSKLRIPELEVNIDGSVSVWTNVVYVLSDAEQLLFTLESYDQQ